MNWWFSDGCRAECLEADIAPALRHSKNIGPSLKPSERLQNILVSPATRELFLHFPWMVFLLHPSFWKALGETAEAEEAAPYLCCSPSQEGEKWGGAGGDPTLWGTVGTSCSHPYNVFATSQGTWHSLSQRHLLACHLRICPTDAAAWAGVKVKTPPWSSSYFIMILNSGSVF